MKFAEYSNEIWVIGCGGIGSQFSHLLAQFVRSQRGVFSDSNFHFVDADIVEESNLDRQWFNLEHVGRPKSLITAARFLETSGRSWRNVASYNGFFGTGLSFEQLVTYRRQIFILCVDNVETRQLIWQHIKGDPEQDLPNWCNRAPWAIIDTGNTIDTGWCVTSVWNESGNVLLGSDPRLLYGNIGAQDPDDFPVEGQNTGSCQRMQESVPQILEANVQTALCAMRNIRSMFLDHQFFPEMQWAFRSGNAFTSGFEVDEPIRFA